MSFNYKIKYEKYKLKYLNLKKNIYGGYPHQIYFMSVKWFGFDNQYNIDPFQTLINILISDLVHQTIRENGGKIINIYEQFDQTVDEIFQITSDSETLSKLAFKDQQTMLSNLKLSSLEECLGEFLNEYIITKDELLTEIINYLKDDIYLELNDRLFDDIQYKEYIKALLDYITTTSATDDKYVEKVNGCIKWYKEREYNNVFIDLLDLNKLKIEYHYQKLFIKIKKSDINKITKITEITLSLFIIDLLVAIDHTSFQYVEDISHMSNYELMTHTITETDENSITKKVFLLYRLVKEMLDSNISYLVYKYAERVDWGHLGIKGFHFLVNKLKAIITTPVKILITDSNIGYQDRLDTDKEQILNAKRITDSDTDKCIKCGLTICDKDTGCTSVEKCILRFLEGKTIDGDTLFMLGGNDVLDLVTLIYDSINDKDKQNLLVQTTLSDLVDKLNVIIINNEGYFNLITQIKTLIDKLK